MAIQKLNPVKSSYVKGEAYDEAKQELTLEFPGNKIFTYSGISKETYDNFIGSESKGKFFHSELKGKFDAKPFNTTPEPDEQA